MLKGKSIIYPICCERPVESVTGRPFLLGQESFDVGSK